MKTAVAIELIAEYLPISRREVRKLFFNEMPVPMSDATRHGIRVGVANAFRHLAAQLRDWANECDDDAWEVEASERKLCQGAD